MSHLETFTNPRPERDYEITDPLSGIHVGVPEDRASRLRRDPHRLRTRPACIELKSLKLYLSGYRNQGMFYEAVTNKILDDLVAACHPRRMTVTGAFTARGGITTTVVATHAAE